MPTKVFEYGPTRVIVHSPSGFWFLPPDEMQAEFDRQVQAGVPWAVETNEAIRAIEDSLRQQKAEGG